MPVFLIPGYICSLHFASAHEEYQCLSTPSLAASSITFSIGNIFSFEMPVRIR
jgi:hypothetical protein